MFERIVGKETSDIAQTQYLTDYEFTFIEQGVIDNNANAFLEKYSTDELADADVITVLATDPMIPETTLSE